MRVRGTGKEDYLHQLFLASKQWRRSQALASLLVMAGFLPEEIGDFDITSLS